MISQQATPLGFVSVAVTPTTAVGFTAGFASGTTAFVTPTGVNVKVLLVAESGRVRWRDDKTAPTPTSGMLMGATQAPFEYSGDVAAIKFISVSGTVAIDCAFYATGG